MYNIYFEFAATGFLGILLLYLHIEYPKASESNRRYREWVMWILICAIVDIVATRTTDYGHMIPPMVNIIINTFYFMVSAEGFWSMAKYLHSLFKGNYSDKYMAILGKLIYVWLGLMVVNIFTGWIFTFDETGTYMHGSYYFLIFVFQIIVNGMSVFLLVINWKNMEKRQRMAIGLFVAIIVGGFLLQVVFFQKTLLIFYMFSLAAMTSLFVIETPDYLKLAQALDEVEEQRKRADIANEAKSNFLANMSHEIRTPMNAIIGMDEMILREARDAKVKRYAHDIKSAGNTLLSIINDILDLSKIESGKMELVPTEYEVASVINDVVNMTAKKADDKGLKYELTADENTPSVLFGDEIRVRQVMLNIINNAIKYTQEGSVTTRIDYDRDVGCLRISVRDTGMGIKPEDMEKLFQAFQRLDETRNRKVEGTGLGLSITKRLVEIMDGSINVESEYGKGTAFFVELSQRIVDDTPIGDYSERLKQAREEESEFVPTLCAPKACILIVDDNDMNLEVITELLSETRIKITTAVSGQECIELLKENTYDVVLLDQMMPGMSGTQTLSVIKSEHLADGTPVIALTADAIVGARENYMSAGFVDYLTKPIKYEKLESTLKEYIPVAKQEEPGKKKELPVLLIWGDDPGKLREAKDNFSGYYKCVCVVGEEKKDQYLKKHPAAGVLQVMEEE
ncbi:MAG: response regulator [Lachnospiraceae bacterium]|nr:response regulator [Lachnospiraceae bacterium]